MASIASTSTVTIVQLDPDTGDMLSHQQLQPSQQPRQEPVAPPVAPPSPPGKGKDRDDDVPEAS